MKKFRSIKSLKLRKKRHHVPTIFKHEEILAHLFRECTRDTLTKLYPYHSKILNTSIIYSEIASNNGLYKCESFPDVCLQFDLHNTSKRQNLNLGYSRLIQYAISIKDLKLLADIINYDYTELNNALGDMPITVGSKPIANLMESCNTNKLIETIKSCNDPEIITLIQGKLNSTPFSEVPIGELIQSKLSVIQAVNLGQLYKLIHNMDISETYDLVSYAAVQGNLNLFTELNAETPGIILEHIDSIFDHAASRNQTHLINWLLTIVPLTPAINQSMLLGYIRGGYVSQSKKAYQQYLLDFKDILKDDTDIRNNNYTRNTEDLTGHFRFIRLLVCIAGTEKCFNWVLSLCHEIAVNHDILLEICIIGRKPYILKYILKHNLSYLPDIILICIVADYIMLIKIIVSEYEIGIKVIRPI